MSRVVRAWIGNGPTAPTSHARIAGDTVGLTDARTVTYTPGVVGGYPTAANTGVPVGTTLTTYTGGSSPAAGTVIQDKIITTAMVITNNNITFRRCRFEGYHARLIESSEGASGLLVEDCEFNGHGTGNTGNECAVSMAWSPGGIVRRCNIYGVFDGLRLGWGGNQVIRDNYIHDLTIAGSDPHCDGIQSLGTDGGLIEHNSIIVPVGSTSCIILSTGSGNQNDVTMNNNLLAGGQYCIYGGYQPGVDPPANVGGIVISNNHISTVISPTGSTDPAGDVFTSVGTPNVTVSGNVWHDGPKAGQIVTEY